MTRSKGLVSLAKELGFLDLSNVVHVGTDSSAAKSFVNRQGLGKMRHLEIRDLWLQKEVAELRSRLTELSAENADLKEVCARNGISCSEWMAAQRHRRYFNVLTAFLFSRTAPAILMRCSFY